MLLQLHEVFIFSHSLHKKRTYRAYASLFTALTRFRHMPPQAKHFMRCHNARQMMIFIINIDDETDE